MELVYQLSPDGKCHTDELTAIKKHVTVDLREYIGNANAFCDVKMIFFLLSSMLAFSRGFFQSATV